MVLDSIPTAIYWVLGLCIFYLMWRADSLKLSRRKFRLRIKFKKSRKHD